MTGAGGGTPPSRTPALLLGLGLGGFVDGIVLHQVLQWHHMVSDVAAYPTSTVAGLEMNTLADGFFHAVMWVLVLVGTIALVRSWRAGALAPSWSFHLGLLLAGWGIFNVVEGLVDHQLLGIHHVRDDLGAPPSWDIGFLVVSVVMVVAGLALHRRGVASIRPARPRQTTSVR
ncbi:MAG: DUF2243 domain-containing protein [Ornithinibacter sp.]